MENPFETILAKQSELMEEILNLRRMIAELSPEQEQPISFKEACGFVGLSERKMRELVANEMIPCHRPPGVGNYSFFRSELTQWVKGNYELRRGRPRR